MLWIAFTLYSGFCFSKDNPVNPNVDFVSTYLIKDDLIRVVKFNTEIQPCLRLEVLVFGQAGFEITHSENLCDIEVKEYRKYNLNELSGIYYEKFGVDKDVFFYHADLFIPKAESILARCEVRIKDGKLVRQPCRKIYYPKE